MKQIGLAVVVVVMAHGFTENVDCKIKKRMSLEILFVLRMRAQEITAGIARNATSWMAITTTK